MSGIYIFTCGTFLQPPSSIISIPPPAVNDAVPLELKSCCSFLSIAAVLLSCLHADHMSAAAAGLNPTTAGCNFFLLYW